MAGQSGYHVLTRDGDGTAEIEALIRRYGSASEAGLHRFFYVSRADQTVVMTTGPDAPIADSLRQLEGWHEPGAEATS